MECVGLFGAAVSAIFTFFLAFAVGANFTPDCIGSFEGWGRVGAAWPVAFALVVGGLWSATIAALRSDGLSLRGALIAPATFVGVSLAFYASSVAQAPDYVERAPGPSMCDVYE